MSLDNKYLRVGVIGIGARSTLARHAEDPGNDAGLVAAVDPTEAGKKRVKRLLGNDLPVFSTVEELVNFGIDAAFVTSPDDTHAEITCALLENGISVYLEKPIATTLADADRVLNAAFASGTKLYVGHNMRHMAVVKQMREIIQDGQIGEVKAIWCRHFVGNGGDYYFKDWHADRRHSTGLLLQKGAHDIDVIHWLAQSYTREVCAMGDLAVYGAIEDHRDNSNDLMSDWFSFDHWPPENLTGLNPVVDVEDISMMLMKLESGVLASYQQCHFTPDYWRNYTVIGTRGRLENFGDGDGAEIKVWNRRSGYNPHGDLRYPIKGDAQGHDDADQKTVKEFFEFIREQAQATTSPLGAREAVATAIAATDSLRSGARPIEVPPVSGKIREYFANNQNS